MLPSLVPDSKTGQAVFDCEPCTEGLPEAVRASYHCGYMDREKWLPCELPKSFDGEVYRIDVCPGWVTRQPAVVEAAMAFDAYEHGEFTNFYPDTPNRLVESVQAMARSLKRYEVFQLRKSNGNNG